MADIEDEICSWPVWNVGDRKIKERIGAILSADIESVLHQL